VTPYTYGAYGEPSDWGPLRFRYTGQIALQEAQLYHYKARVYDPTMGRFLQTDPVGYDAGDLNLYGYVKGDPTNRTDPSGNTDVGEVVVTAARNFFAPAWVTFEGTYAGQPFRFTFAVPSMGFRTPVYNQSSDDGSAASDDSRDSSGTAATPPDPDDDDKNTTHAKDRMNERGVSQERVDEAKRIGREKPGKTPNEVVKEVPSSQSSSGRGVRVVIDRVTGRVVTVIDKGSKFK
jgi:RHS repeat-associated protein